MCKIGKFEGIIKLKKLQKYLETKRGRNLRKVNVVSLCVCYQENQFFLKQALNSVMNFSDKIVVVDGSPFGPSTDGTRDMLEKLQKENPYKIVAAEGTFKDLWEQKNAAMKLGLREKPDYFFTVDADEVYRENDLLALRYIIEADNAPEIVMFSMYHTWRDFNHHQIGGPFSNPFIRLFKVQDGIHYDPPPAGDEPKDVKARYLKTDLWYKDKTLYLGRPLTFHYGHSKTIWFEFLKVLRYAKWENASLEAALRRIAINGWFERENREPLLDVKPPLVMEKYEDPCKHCPKHRHLIWYCKEKCPIGKNIKYEEPMYDLGNLKETLEKNEMIQEEL